MALAVDIETDGLNATRITALCWINIETGEEVDCYHNIESGLRTLMEYDGELVFHNGIDFDVPTIKRLYDWWQPRHRIVDTLVRSRFVYQDMLGHDLRTHTTESLRKVDDRARLGSHGLATWGVRLGFAKQEFEGDWGTEYTPALGEYCLQDCRVTRRLYLHLKDKGIDERVDLLEHQFAELCVQLRTYGFAFDVQGARDLEQELQDRSTIIEDQMLETFGGWYAPVGEVVVPKRSVRYKDKPHVAEGCPYQKVEFVLFNSNSRQHIEKVLVARGWSPSEHTPSGQAKVDEKTLRAIAPKFPEAELLADNFMVTKRLALVRSWLEHGADGRIRAQVVPNAAITGRTSSRSPNLQQVPRVGSPYGEESRCLFTASPGRKLLASDLDRAELTMLAHYLDDNGEYGKLLQSADIHQVNADRMGITRAQMKGVQFGFIYGAGDRKLGEMTGLPGGEVRKRLFAAIPGLEDLIAKVQREAKSNGYITSIDGRRIPVEKEHTALNYLIQSATSSAAKYWAVRCAEQMRGLECDMVLYVHDELQFDCAEHHLQPASVVIKECLRQSNDYFNLSVPMTCDTQVGDNWSESH